MLAVVLEIGHGGYGSFGWGAREDFCARMDGLRGRRRNLHTAQPGPKLLLSHQVTDIVCDSLGKGAAERHICGR